MYHILQTGDLAVPTLAGEPFMKKPLLLYLTAALFANLFSGVLPLHDGARLASAFYMALALLFTALTTRELYGRGRAAVLALLACLGLAPWAHLLITDTALLAGIALGLYGFALGLRKHAIGGVLLGTGAGIAFLSKGLLGPGLLGLTALALPTFHETWRTRAYFLSLCAGVTASLPWLLIWPTTPYLRSPELFSVWIWDNNFGRLLGTSGLGPKHETLFYLRTLPWFAWPAWVLAAWGLWAAGRDGLRRPVHPDAKCGLILRQEWLSDPPMHDPREWRILWEGRHPGGSNEKFRLYQRYRTMRFRILLVASLGIGTTSAAIADPLPDRLELEYSLSRGNMEIGEVSRRLERRPDGNYAHSMRTRSTGFARLLTNTEWREEGEFTVRGTEVLPQRFSETRTGDKRAYEHRVTFDQKKSRAVFSKDSPQPLPPGLQDQGSVIYALMLNPLTQPGERSLPQTDGKEIETYHFSYQGKESLPTPFGTREATVIRRVSQKRLERERECRVQNLKKPDCTQPDDFTLWLLPEKHYVPVKLERRRKGETTTMNLREALGL